MNVPTSVQRWVCECTLGVSTHTEEKIKISLTFSDSSKTIPFFTNSSFVFAIPSGATVLYKHPLWHESWSLVRQHLWLFLSHTHQKPIHTHKDLSLHVLKGQQIKMFVYSRRYPKMLSKSPLQDFFPFWQWCPYLKEAIKVSYINKLFLGSFVCHGQGIREALYAMARGIAWEFEGIRGLKVAQTRGLGGQAPPENV